MNGAYNEPYQEGMGQILFAITRGVAQSGHCTGVVDFWWPMHLCIVLCRPVGRPVGVKQQHGLQLHVKVFPIANTSIVL